MLPPSPRICSEERRRTEGKPRTGMPQSGLGLARPPMPCPPSTLFRSSLLVMCLSQPPSLHCLKSGVTMRKGAGEGLETMRRIAHPGQMRKLAQAGCVLTGHPETKMKKNQEWTRWALSSCRSGLGSSISDQSAIDPPRPGGDKAHGQEETHCPGRDAAVLRLCEPPPCDFGSFFFIRPSTAPLSSSQLDFPRSGSSAIDWGSARSRH
ncbi:hypothetical protein Trisim1_008281 [Trichoderma cf. simile WF8]